MSKKRKQTDRKVSRHIEKNEELLVCKNCHRKYSAYDSDAERNDKFCCIACEFGY